MVQTGKHGKHLGPRLQSINLPQLRQHGLIAQRINCRRIHAGGKVVPNLLLHGRPIRRLGVLFQNTPKKLLVVVRQLGVNAPRRLIGGDGIVFLPTAASELVEILAGIRCAIEAGHVERWRVRHSLQGLRRRRLRGKA